MNLLFYIVGYIYKKIVIQLTTDIFLNIKRNKIYKKKIQTSNTVGIYNSSLNCFLNFFELHQHNI